MTFHSEAQLYSGLVDHIKKAIQDLCWERLTRDFKLYLQVRPPALPVHPYGQYEPLDYDSNWGEVLNSHQISFAADRIVLRAHHSGSPFD